MSQLLEFAKIAFFFGWFPMGIGGVCLFADMADKGKISRDWRPDARSIVPLGVLGPAVLLVALTVLVWRTVRR